MPNHPCDVHINCPGVDSPFSNFSAEAPDQDIFIGYGFSWDYNVPKLNYGYGNPDTSTFCDSPVSQSDADLCAKKKQPDVLGDDGTVYGTPSGKWTTPKGTRVTTYLNAIQACNITCPDGSLFSFTVPAGTVRAFNQAQANAIAASLACILARKVRFCFSTPILSACLSTPVQSSLSVTGSPLVPVTLAVTAGTLPPGVTLQQTGSTTWLIAGTPMATGNYVFTLTATDSRGLFVQNTFTMPVLGITNSNTITTATTGQAYSYQLVPDGGTAPYTVSVIGGVLPDGLSMDTTGLITGTPTGNTTTPFTVQLLDSTGNACLTSITIPFTPDVKTCFTTASGLPSSNVGVAYYQVIVPTDGPAQGNTLVANVTSGSLPPGLTLNYGFPGQPLLIVIQGNITGQGNFTFTVTLTESSGGGG